MMARYILDCLTRQKIVLFSWGFHKAIALENGLRFSVNGFIFKGIVNVIYNEGTDLFDIKLININKAPIIISDVPIDMLIDTLDTLIEKNENDKNYKERVKQEYDSLL